MHLRTFLSFFALGAAALQALAVGCSGSDAANASPDAGGVDATSDAPNRADASPTDAGPTGDADAAPADAAPSDAAPSDAADERALVYTPDGSLWVNTGPCGLGEVGATFLGVPAYCQPADASTTGYYQCDELANRFVRDALHHPELDNVVTDFASTICDNVMSNPAYSVWGPRYRPTAGHVPVPGDLIVFSGQPGHVAVLTGFADPTHMTMIQQNGGPSVARVPWSASQSFFPILEAECWIHAEPAAPSTLPTSPSCGCFDNGDTCGLAIVDHEWWYGCSAQVPDGGVAYQSLYTCDGGVFEKKEDCSSLCITPNLFDASGACGQ